MIMAERISGTDHIEIYPVAGESFGVRGFCFKICTPDLSIILDPGCSLGPRKDQKIPHPFEFKKLYQLTDLIIHESKRCSHVFISHFHHDHFKPNIEDNFLIHSNNSIFSSIYTGKTIFTKNHQNKINYNQKERALKFFRDLRKIECTHRSIADNFGELTIREDFVKIYSELVKNNIINDTFAIGKTIFIFPKEYLHGERKDRRKFYVQPLIIIYCSEVFYYFPDVQGIANDIDFHNLMKIKIDINRTINQTIDPNLNVINVIAVGGMRDFNQNSHEHTKKIIEKFDISIIDHHLMRSKLFFEIWSDYHEVSRIKGGCVRSMNSNLHPNEKGMNEINLEKMVMECFRSEMYEQFPPSKSFKKWLDFNQREKKAEKSTSH